LRSIIAVDDIRYVGKRSEKIAQSIDFKKKSERKDWIMMDKKYEWRF